MSKNDDQKIEVATKLGELKTDIKYIREAIDELKVDSTVLERQEIQCRENFEIRMKKVEQFQDRQKWYIAGIGAAIGFAIFLIDKIIDWGIKFKN